MRQAANNRHKSCAVKRINCMEKFEDRIGKGVSLGTDRASGTLFLKKYDQISSVCG